LNIIIFGCFVEDLSMFDKGVWRWWGNKKELLLLVR
jgi:hypothetical protein